MKKRLLSLVLGSCLAFTITTQSAQAAETDSTLVAPALSAAPIIDGTIDAAWAAIPYSQMHNKLTNGATSDQDYSVKFKVGWKGTFVYVLIDVTDNIVATNPLFSNYQQDYTMIFMDLIKDSTEYKDENSFFYRINADNTLSDGRFFNNWNAPEEGVVAASSLKTGGYIVEYAVDASKFQLMSLKGGEVIGFDIETGDNDDAALAQRTSQYLWSSTSTGDDWDTPIGQVGYITLGQGSPVVVAETDSTVMAPNLSSAIVIDGSIDAAWNAIPYSQMHNKLVNGAASDNDYSVKFKVGWNATTINVLIDVTDNIVATNSLFSNYQQDYTMIFMDLIKDSTDYKDENSFFYRINADNTLSDGRFFNNWNAPEEGVVAATSLKTGGYIAEYAVDASKFQLMSLKGGDVIGFNIETGDNDDAALAQRTSQYLWSSTSTGEDWASPIGQVGYITLGDFVTGIKNKSTVEMKMYPNPASSEVRLSSDASNVEIYNITGSKVLTVKEVSANSPINVSGLKGIYMVKATDKSGKIVTKKLLIK